ncbi:MAG: SAM-dependent chlorinase/fluorinase [Saprospiraceae bacterium]|nr:SAM-dependent chlorinase/fluorinase [Saprospiraceae bacterium]MDW8230388.1 SAM-dependent chlorinase/fluorinase [Saprospiraceae bacterium]
MRNRPIISLTTDFGLRDYYVGALKGALLRACPEACLVDVSHAVRPFDIVEAAFLVENARIFFPEGSMHLIGVHCAYAPDFRFVVVQRDGHYFAAPDNGVLSLIFEGELDARSLPVSDHGAFPVMEAFALAVGHLGAGQTLDTLGVPAGPLMERVGLRPVTTRSRIRGMVMRVDNFDNVQVNIQRETFERIGRGRPFSLFFKRHDPITVLSHHYADVPEGEPLCWFNSAGYLEIAVNMGRAATLFGLKEEDVVEVVFEELPEGSVTRI